MLFKSKSLFFILLISLSFSHIHLAYGSPLDGTAFVKGLVQEELKNGEKECKKIMRNTASCKIKIQKVLISKEGDDSAKIKVISDLKIKTKYLIKASATTEIIANATYKLHSCEINIHDVNKKIKKLTGAASLLKPFEKSIKNISVPTGKRPIKSTATRDKADKYLKNKLKLSSTETAKSC